ncbi:transcription factor jumonji, partial [Lophiostoma macrostomum CBS 122681]
MPSDYAPFVDAGSRLRQRNGGNIPGVNTPFWYISQCEKTPATLHIEDGALGSVNLLLAGAPKLWLLVPEHEKEKLEGRMKELYGTAPFACSQKIRHYDALVSPSLLEQWGVTYYLDCSLPGEMMVTRRNTYHQVLNMGPNVAESVNI